MKTKKWTVWTAVEIRRIRTNTGLSQRKFCTLFGIEYKMLKGWEQGLIVPDGVACLFWSFIKYDYHASLFALDTIDKGIMQDVLKREKTALKENLNADG